MKMIQVEEIILNHGREETRYASNKLQECETWGKFQKMKVEKFIVWEMRNEGCGKSWRASKSQKEG